MTYRLLNRIGALIVCFLGLFIYTVAAAGRELPDFTELVRQNGPAVVNISTTFAADDEKPDSEQPEGMPDLPPGSPLNEFFRKFFGDRPPYAPDQFGPSSSLGSGFIISADGYVISNYHVVKNASEVIVRLSDRREYKAKVIGSDARSDIAVLKVKADDPLPVLKLGKSAQLEVGEWVLAIGSPFGFDHSVTAGIVSAKGRSLPNENYVPFIQTDVAINPGNSGGPLFNLDGEVVGVNSQIYSRTGGFMGLSFAIPIDVVMNVYKQLRETGMVRRGWLGVLIQDVTRELAESFQMNKPHGALISKVLPDSPAAAAGIEAGDVIINFDGQAIDASADLPPLVGATAAGKKVPVEVVRGGGRKTLTIEIGELPADDEQLLSGRGGSPGTTRVEKLAIEVRNLGDSDRDDSDVPEGGVLVTKVNRGPAADAGVQEGDVIVQLNFKPIENVDGFKKLVKALESGTRIPILVQRRNNPFFMALRIPEQE